MMTMTNMQGMTKVLPGMNKIYPKNSINRYRVCKIFIKILTIMLKSTNVYDFYVYDPQGTYILLVNNFVNPITYYGLTLLLTIRRRKP